MPSGPEFHLPRIPEGIFSPQVPWLEDSSSHSPPGGSAGTWRNSCREVVPQPHGSTVGASRGCSSVLLAPGSLSRTFTNLIYITQWPHTSSESLSSRLVPHLIQITPTASSAHSAQLCALVYFLAVLGISQALSMLGECSTPELCLQSLHPSWS